MSAAVSEKIAEIDGIPVHYREVGQGEAIVYLHGAGGAPPQGASFVSLLAETHRVLVPSRPGFDETPIGGCKTQRDVANVMAGFIRKTCQGPAHVIAQSAGGAIGCWLAVEHPDLVASLVLSAPAAFAVRHGGGAPPSAAELAHRLYGDTPSWSAPPTAAENERIAKNADANMARFAAAAGNKDLEARLAEIKAPTLLLVATDDRLIPAEAMAPYQRHIHTCYRMFIYGAAHELPISAAPRWVNLVADFIDRGEAWVVNIGNQVSAA